MVEPRYPNESTAYREAREALLEQEKALIAKVNEVAAMRVRFLKAANSRKTMSSFAPMTIVSAKKFGYPSYSAPRTRYCHVFTRHDESIHHFWASEMQGNHVDMIWAYWNLMDMTPQGRPDLPTPPQNFRSQYLEKHYL